jgi:hypothetical protein
MPLMHVCMLVCCRCAQPKAYKATVSVEAADGSVNDVEQEVNEAADLVALAATGKKAAAGLRINGEKYTVVRTYTAGGEKKDFGDLIVYGAKGVRYLRSR